MTASLFHAMQQIGQFRTAIAVGVPLLGGALVVASSILIPRGKAKGLITGAYMLSASMGLGCLFFAFIGAITGIPTDATAPFFLLGIVFTAVIGIFIPEVIRQYQGFEVRKLAAEIFRRT